jgi:hypothetical protein
VHDLDIFGVASGPAKAHAELIVHPQAPLTRAIALQLFEPVRRRPLAGNATLARQHRLC